MQYAIISVINGSWNIEVETNNLQQAKVNFHQRCATLWNASDVTLARVWIVDQSLGQIESEEIRHDKETATQTEG